MINSFVLHILAIITMTCDHVWSVINGYEFLTWVGRLAFPLFAFSFLTMIVFYFFRGKSWFNLLWQFIGMYIINCVMYTGEYKIIDISKMSVNMIYNL